MTTMTKIGRPTVLILSWFTNHPLELQMLEEDFSAASADAMDSADEGCILVFNLLTMFNCSISKVLKRHDG